MAREKQSERKKAALVSATAHKGIGGKTAEELAKLAVDKLARKVAAKEAYNKKENVRKQWMSKLTPVQKEALKNRAEYKILLKQLLHVHNESNGVPNGREDPEELKEKFVHTHCSHPLCISSRLNLFKDVTLPESVRIHPLETNICFDVDGKLTSDGIIINYESEVEIVVAP